MASCFPQLRAEEDAARERARLEMERRRELALQRREQNLESRSHLANMKRSQGLTKPWVFSYYSHWPRESYEALMGGDGSRKSGGSRRVKRA